MFKLGRHHKVKSASARGRQGSCIISALKLSAEQGPAVPWVVLKVTLSGINIRDLNEKGLHLCQDELDKHWFSFILKEGERHLCHDLKFVHAPKKL
uniref:Uncharacterized protein n=1 Tax=Globodera rostochiensis TaxID=31243 RepID=A0A914GRR8_GLORO